MGFNRMSSEYLLWDEDKVVKARAIQRFKKTLRWLIAAYNSVRHGPNCLYDSFEHEQIIGDPEKVKDPSAEGELSRKPADQASGLVGARTDHRLRKMLLGIGKGLGPSRRFAFPRVLSALQIHLQQHCRRKTAPRASRTEACEENSQGKVRYGKCGRGSQNSVA